MWSRSLARARLRSLRAGHWRSAPALWSLRRLMRAPGSPSLRPPLPRRCRLHPAYRQNRFPAPGAMPAVSRPLPESPIAKLSPSEPVGVGVVCVAVPVLMTAAVGTGVAAGGGVAGAASSPVSSFLPAVLPPPAFVTETGVPVCGTLAVVATAALSAAAATLAGTGRPGRPRHSHSRSCPPVRERPPLSAGRERCRSHWR